MALDTYANLQTAIINMAMRSGDTDFAAFVPDAITLAEDVMQNGTSDIDPVSMPDMEQTSTAALSSGQATLPSDFSSMRRLVIAGRPPLQYAAPEWLDENYPTTPAGVPEFFTVTGSVLKVFPTSSETVTMTYYKQFPALSVSNTTNFILTKNPGLYLYGALIHCAPFMMDDARVSVWAGLYKGLVAGVNKADMMARYSRPTARVSGTCP